MSQCGYIDELSIHSKVRNDRFVLLIVHFYIISPYHIGENK